MEWLVPIFAIALATAMMYTLLLLVDNDWKRGQVTTWDKDGNEITITYIDRENKK